MLVDQSNNRVRLLVDLVEINLIGLEKADITTIYDNKTVIFDG